MDANPPESSDSSEPSFSPNLAHEDEMEDRPSVISSLKPIKKKA